MKKRPDIKTIIGGTVLAIVALAIVFFGYYVISSSGDVPGKLTDISKAVQSRRPTYATFKKAQKVDYDMMRYGYMDSMHLAEMDALDQQFSDKRLAEVRKRNDLTAMRDKDEENLAYQEYMEAENEAAQAAIQRVQDALLAKEEAAAAARKRIEEEKAAAAAATNAGYPGGYQYIDTGDSSNTGSGDTASRGGQVGQPVYAATHGASLGTYVITAYCTCRVCCGVYSGRNRTASGTVPTSNRTIAVDTNDIPFNTRVVINGQIYVAEDRGGAIKGKRIDMFFMTHAEALRWGKRTMEVYLAD